MEELTNLRWGELEYWVAYALPFGIYEILIKQIIYEYQSSQFSNRFFWVNLN
jgi:hypothetical protein